MTLTIRQRIDELHDKVIMTARISAEELTINLAEILDIMKEIDERIRILEAEGQ